MRGALSAFAVLSDLSVPLAQAQTDPRLVDVIRDAQEGQGDSARIKVQQLLATTSPSDTLYPQILYTQAMVATDAGEMRRQLQRVAVEHSSSSWADDALLRLVQLDYASANLEGAARNLERIRRDYPGTTLLPQASYWAARTYFDQKNPAMACRWLADGLSASRGNVELQNQLGYLNQRCSNVVLDSSPRPAVDSGPALASAAPDTARPAPRDSTPAPRPSGPTLPSAGTQPARDSTPPVKPTPPTATVSDRFRIQITAVRTAAAAQTVATKLKGRGLSAVIVEDGGLYKVRVGSYATKADAIAALPGIKAKLGGSPFVVAGP
jgi:cell division septation protein DedD